MGTPSQYSYAGLSAMNIEIIDFSPEWDYTTGGSKLLVCIKPNLENLPEDIEQKFECGFGDHLVPVRFIQPGVFKCHAPPHEPGFVNLSLLFEGNILNIKQQDVCKSSLFEYRQQIPKSIKKKRTRLAQQSDAQFEGDTRECKVRIVEKLISIEQKLNHHQY